MYYPYLRGKRFELYAVNECIDVVGESEGIIPIIEPVNVPKDENSDLHKCLSIIQDKNKKAILVVNPKVGNAKAVEDIDTFIKIANKFESVDIAFIIDRTFNEMIANKVNSLTKDLYLIHNSETSDKKAIETISKYSSFKSHICEADKKSIVRNYNVFSGTQSYIVLNDPFPKEDRNADYSDNSEEIFTRQHQYYQEDGFSGFSDYATVGSDFSDLGFMPRVVAIHFTYKKSDDLGIWIRHFVSKDNSETTADIAGKYAEARNKLFKFLGDNNITNLAIEQWTKGHDDDRYEGLGKIKQYSLVNHFYVVKEVMDAAGGA